MITVLKDISIMHGDQEESLRWTEKYLNHTTNRPDDRIANVLRSQSTPPTHATHRQPDHLERSRSRALGPRSSEIRDTCLTPLLPLTTAIPQYIPLANRRQPSRALDHNQPTFRALVRHQQPLNSGVCHKPPSGPLVIRKQAAKRRPDLPMICYQDNSKLPVAS